jgi:hypothetical protein
MGLQLRDRTPKRCEQSKPRQDRTDACQINQAWAMEFVHAEPVIGWPPVEGRTVICQSSSAALCISGIGNSPGRLVNSV